MHVTNVIDGRNRKMEIDTEMDTEIEMVMEIDTEIDTEILIYGHCCCYRCNLAHPQPFSDDKVETAWGIPFGFRKAMGRKGAAVAAAFHR